jgi:hypothetical protein
LRGQVQTIAAIGAAYRGTLRLVGRRRCWRSPSGSSIIRRLGEIAYIRERMLQHLTLGNFEAHEDATIDFARFTGLVGENGSGKTSVLDATQCRHPDRRL